MVDPTQNGIQVHRDWTRTAHSDLNPIERTVYTVDIHDLTWFLSDETDRVAWWQADIGCGSYLSVNPDGLLMPQLTWDKNKPHTKLVVEGFPENVDGSLNLYHYLSLTFG